MKLIVLITEKSMRDAKSGKYTFEVEPKFSKSEIKKEVEDTFGVHVVKVRTSKVGGKQKRNMRGFKQISLPTKKVRVTLKEKESIDLFEEKKK